MLHLLAQAAARSSAEQTGFVVGMIVGALVVGGLCGLAPLLIGRSRGRAGLGTAGFVCCLGGGLLAGIIGAIPIAVIFTIILFVMPNLNVPPPPQPPPRFGPR